MDIKTELELLRRVEDVVVDTHPIPATNVASEPLVVVVDDDINEDIKQQTKVEKQHDHLMLFTAETRARLRHARLFVAIKDNS